MTSVVGSSHAMGDLPVQERRGMTLRAGGGLWRAAALLAACALGAPPAGAVDAPSPPVSVAVRLSQDAESARLSFDFSAPVEARARTLSAPDRIVVDLPEVDFQIDPSEGRAKPERNEAIVRAFRFGMLAPGRSRIVIDLGRLACPGDPESRPIAKGAPASRLTIPIKRCNAAAFAAKVEPAAVAEAPVQDAPVPAATSGPPVIVLDPGHGGVDGGAIGPHGAVEKDLVFAYASELKRQLDATHRYKVAMTRDGDSFVSLDDRVKMARDANAALFISIHADTLSDAADVSGATVYTCADRASDAEAARIAERENAADKAAGVERKADAPDIAGMLFDLKRRETRTYAHLFSRGLVGEWRTAGRLNHNPERAAGFVVLKAPDFPSVLVELGYLSNPQDVKDLASPQWREKTAAAMTIAIQKFFAGPAGQDGAADVKTNDEHGLAMTGAQSESSVSH
jgi:N-acetylmuramoyl-L-alanine amidase